MNSVSIVEAIRCRIIRLSTHWRDAVIFTKIRYTKNKNKSSGRCIAYTISKPMKYHSRWYSLMLLVQSFFFLIHRIFFYCRNFTASHQCSPGLKNNPCFIITFLYINPDKKISVVYEKIDIAYIRKAFITSIKNSV